jgi:hypothetical protein
MTLIWVHEDAMTLDHPVMQAAGADAQAIFIWDTDEHDRREYSAKRRVFIYECAHDLDIPIYAGDPYEILKSLADGGRVYAVSTPDPYTNAIISDLRDELEVITIDSSELAQIPANTDTGRFFRFWNRAKKTALTHSTDVLE